MTSICKCMPEKENKTLFRSLMEVLMTDSNNQICWLHSLKPRAKTNLNSLSSIRKFQPVVQILETRAWKIKQESSLLSLLENSHESLVQSAQMTRLSNMSLILIYLRRTRLSWEFQYPFKSSLELNWRLSRTYNNKVRPNRFIFSDNIQASKCIILIKIYKSSSLQIRNFLHLGKTIATKAPLE